MSRKKPYEFLEPGSVRTFLCRKAKGDVQVMLCLQGALERHIARRSKSALRLESLPSGASAWEQNRWDACGGEIYAFNADPALEQEVGQIAAWLSYELAADASWLRERDRRGTPRRLASAAYEHLVRKADFWHRHGEGVAPQTQDVRSWPCGTRLVRLLNVAAMIEEGARMNHCVGTNVLHRLNFARGQHYYSLRGPAGESLATLHILPGEMLAECKGPFNQPPPIACRKLILEVVRAEGLRLHPAPDKTGFLERGGAFYDIFALPENFTANGSFTYEKISSHFSLPPGLSLGGDLKINEVDGLHALRGPLRVGGVLKVEKSRFLSEIKGPIDVAGSFDLQGLQGLRGIRGPIRTGGNVAIYACPALEELPRDWHVPGNLDLRQCVRLRHLPPGLRVDGDLDLRGCNGLRTLPADLVVGGVVKWDELELTNITAARRMIEANSCDLREKEARLSKPGAPPPAPL